MSEASSDTVSHDWERIFSRAIASAYDAVLITDAELEAPGPRILYVNAAFEAMTGYAAEEILGKTPRILQGPETEREVLDRLRHCLEQGEPFEGQTVNYRKDGTPYQLEWRTAPVHDDNGRTQFFVSIQHDVTETTRLLRQLRHQVDRDSLTATYNRGAIEQLVDREVERARRSGMPLSLILLDIDHFKKVNDTHGHQVGDRVLRTVCERVATRIRSTDELGRWGGEELILCIPDTDHEGAVTLAEAIRRYIETTDFQDPINLTISLGVAQWRPGESKESLIGRADQAMYKAKANGRNQVAVAE